MALRESTFITPREGDQDVMKKAHIFTGPLLRLLENFDDPPPLEIGIEGVQSGILSYHRYNLQFLKMSDILKQVLLLNKTTDLLLLSPH
jgi:hypothetical protein